jgi:hypothetical protein
LDILVERESYSLQFLDQELSVKPKPVNYAVLFWCGDVCNDDERKDQNIKAMMHLKHVLKQRVH